MPGRTEEDRVRIWNKSKEQLVSDAPLPHWFCLVGVFASAHGYQALGGSYDPPGGVARRIFCAFRLLPFCLMSVLLLIVLC